MKRLSGMLMCAGAGVGLLVGASSAWATTATSGRLFYTTFMGGTNVHRVDYNYDGAATFTLSNNTGIDAVNGADGIVGNPQDSSTVIVGGQSSGDVHVVKRDGSGSVSFASPVTDNYHLEVPDATTLLTSSIPGALGRFTINPGGSLTANGTIPLAGSNLTLTQVITTPVGDFYTSSGAGGVGDYGTLTYDTGPGMASTATGATTVALHTGLPAAHGGVYDPFSNSVLLFGSDHITQLSLAGAILDDIMIAGQNFDQGSVDGLGHVFVASNGGDITFLDYSTAAGGVIDGAGNFIDTQFLAANLDDLAPLIGVGGTNTAVPEPLSVALGVMGLGVLGLATRRRTA